MIYVLSQAGRQALNDLAHDSPLVGFDFDGTLSPIVAEPARAALPPYTRSLLHEVATRFVCVVISGRSRQDVMQRLGDIPLREVFGNHGLEPWHMSQNELMQVSDWKASLTRRLAGIPGVWVEDKCYSLSIHYRQATQVQCASEQILAAIKELGEARIVAGKCVYNVMPNCTTHKGTVLGEAMRHFGCTRALYVGDDHTDEDVFASGDPAQVLSIRVGESPTSHAGYYLHSQAEMDDLLKLLVKS